MTDIQKKAYKDYQIGMKYADIATKYDVTINTVKSWYKRHWLKIKGAPSDKKTAPQKAKKGAPLKNQNAAGNSGGAPERNQNNLKHGAYKKVSWDVLEDDEECELLENIEYVPEEILKNKYKDLLLRKRRLLIKLKEYKEKGKSNQDLILDSVTKIKVNIGDGIEEKTVTVAGSIINVIRIYETELTKISAQEIKIAVELKKMMIADKTNNLNINIKSTDIDLSMLTESDLINLCKLGGMDNNNNIENN